MSRQHDPSVSTSCSVGNTNDGDVSGVCNVYGPYDTK